MESPEISKNMHRTRTMLAVILLIILVATITLALVLHFFPQPGPIQPQASYVISTDGVTTTARNGTTGEIQFSGDSSTVLNDALANAQGVVFVSKGNYTITSSIMMNSSNSLVGEGWETILRADKNLKAAVIDSSNLYSNGATDARLQVANLTIDGANVTGNTIGDFYANGIQWSNVLNSSITGVYIYDCGGEGINLWNCRGIVIENNVIYRNGYHKNDNGSTDVRSPGLLVNAENYNSNAYNITITNNNATGNGMDGINVYNARDAIIKSNTAERNEEDGIFVAQSINTTVFANAANHNGWNYVSFNESLVNGSDGITVENSSDVTVSGNVAFHNGCISYRNGSICPTGDGIAVGRGLRVTVFGNSASFNYGHGINLPGSNNSTVSANIARDNNCSGTNCNLNYTIDGIHLSRENVTDPNDTCQFNVITSNVASDDQTPPTQGWGIAEADQTCNFNVIKLNSCTGNLVGGIKVNGTNTDAEDNINGTIGNSLKECFLANTMSLTKLLWTCTFAFMVYLSFFLLRLSNVLGSEFDILIRWVSAISLILLVVFVGALISQKKIRVRAVLLPFLLFALGFFAAPFVGIGVLMLFENLGFDIPAIFGVSVTAYLLLYMGLWFYLKKRGIFNR